MRKCDSECSVAVNCGMLTLLDVGVQERGPAVLWGVA